MRRERIVGRAVIRSQFVNVSRIRVIPESDSDSLTVSKRLQVKLRRKTEASTLNHVLQVLPSLILTERLIHQSLQLFL